MTRPAGRSWLLGLLIISLFASFAGSNLLLDQCRGEGFAVLGLPIVGGLAVCVGWMMLMRKAGFFVRFVIAVALGGVVGALLSFTSLVRFIGECGN